MKAKTMKRFSILLAILLLLGIVAGCKKDSEPAAPPSPASDVEPNDVTPQSLGTLGATDITTPGTTASDTDVDRFSVSIAAGTNLHVSVAWQGTSDLNIGVMNPNGIMISYQGGTAANPERCTLPSQGAGTYVIEITSTTAAATGYTLTIGPR